MGALVTILPTILAKVTVVVGAQQVLYQVAVICSPLQANQVLEVLEHLIATTKEITAVGAALVTLLLEVGSPFQVLQVIHHRSQMASQVKQAAAAAVAGGQTTQDVMAVVVAVATFE